MKYYWPYIRGMHPINGSTALRYGVVWHKAMEAFYGAVKEFGWNSGTIIEKAMLAAKAEWESYSAKQTFWDDYRTLENLIISLLAFIDHFAGDEGMIEIIEPETKFKILMPATDVVEEFYFTGKIDLELLLNGRFWLNDHKTTGAALSRQTQLLNRSPQFMGYSYAAERVMEQKPDGALVTFHHLSAYKSKKTGLYGKPKIDFARIPQVYSQEDIDDWKDSFYDTVKQIQWCTERNHWPKRFDSCYQYGLCQYAFLCDQHRKEGEEVLEDHFYVDVPWDVLSED